jgi:hypothetical protein
MITYTPSTPLSREHLGQISVGKKYVLPIPVEQLTMDDKVYLVSEYHDPVNIVDENFQRHPTRRPQEAEAEAEGVKMKVTCYSDLVSDGERGYPCPLCRSYYASKQSLVKHLKNQKACRSRQELNALLTGSSKSVLSDAIQDQEASQQQNVHIQQNESIHVNQNRFKINLKIHDLLHS